MISETRDHYVRNQTFELGLYDGYKPRLRYNVRYTKHEGYRNTAIAVLA
jgi:hypothetical protein